MARLVPVDATAQNSRISGAQHTLTQSLADPTETGTQLTPSCDVVTSLPAAPTPTNLRSSGDQQIAYQTFVTPADLETQVIPAVCVTPHPLIVATALPSAF
ncbi:MAG TPA: hypothetical protein PLS53_00050 [Thermoanaerobaculaceae bacterium]|nr:hypothetical protein [Thermoanaerobaculaceae bacterium]